MLARHPVLARSREWGGLLGSNSPFRLLPLLRESAVHPGRAQRKLLGRALSPRLLLRSGRVSHPASAPASRMQRTQVRVKVPQRALAPAFPRGCLRARVRAQQPALAQASLRLSVLHLVLVRRARQQPRSLHLRRRLLEPVPHKRPAFQTLPNRSRPRVRVRQRALARPCRLRRTRARAKERQPVSAPGFTPRSVPPRARARLPRPVRPCRPGLRLLPGLGRPRRRAYRT